MEIISIPPACCIVLPSGEIVLFDLQDSDLVAQHRWAALRSGRSNVYAQAITTDQSDGERKINSVLMHRLIMNAPKGKYVDHIDGSGLDNRRLNLRIVTPSENSMNKKYQKNPYPDLSSPLSNKEPIGFVGVARDNRVGKYRAYFSTGGRNFPKWHYLGAYDKPEEAARIRDAVAVYFDGNRARLNFPMETPEPLSPVAARARFKKKSGGTSKYVGVSLGYKGLWRVNIQDPFTKEVNFLGNFPSEEEAAIAFDSVALFHGIDRSRLNFPDRDTEPLPPDAVKHSNKKRGSLGFLGIYKKRNRFVARLMYDRKLYSLRSFPTPEEAARAYDGMVKFLGFPLKLNFPNEDPTPIDPSTWIPHMPQRRSGAARLRTLDYQ